MQPNATSKLEKKSADNSKIFKFLCNKQSDERYDYVKLYRKTNNMVSLGKYWNIEIKQSI